MCIRDRTVTEILFVLNPLKLNAQKCTGRAVNATKVRLIQPRPVCYVAGQKEKEGVYTASNVLAKAGSIRLHYTLRDRTTLEARHLQIPAAGRQLQQQRDYYQSPDDEAQGPK